MRQILGRKYTSRNEDWIRAMNHIEELISPEEVEQFASDSLSEMREAVAGKRVAYAYSGGKDSIVLADLCEKLSITQGYFSYCELDYPEFIRWVKQNKPAGVEMMHTGLGYGWLKRNQDMIFAEGLLGQRWHLVTQRGSFTRMFFDNHLDLLIVGHRRIDGNFCGRNGYIRKKSGETRYSPMRDWPHEALLGYIHYHNLQLPPIYGWKDGFVQGTHAWPEREFCCDDIMRGYREVYEIDPSIVERAAKYLPSARHFLEQEVGV